MRIVFMIMSGMMLLSCSVKEYYGDLHSGDQVIVNHELVIPANDARVSIQNGVVRKYTQLDYYYPHCWLVSQRREAEPQIIIPGRFNIVGIRHKYETVMKQTGGYLLSAFASGASLTAVEYITELTIYSESQSAISRLYCSHWEDPFDAEHLSLEQMRKTLSPLVSIVQKKNTLPVQ